MSGGRRHWVVLDTPLPIEGGAVAVVARIERDVWSSGGVAAKWPVAVLVCRDGELQAMSPAGNEMSVEDVDKVCPGASEAVLRAAGSSSDS